MGKEDRRRRIFKQCMREAGYETHRKRLTQRAKEPEEPKRKVLRPSEAIQMVEWFVAAYRREVGFPQTAASALNEIQRGLSEGWLEYDIERSGVLVPY